MFSHSRSNNSSLPSSITNSLSYVCLDNNASGVFVFTQFSILPTLYCIFRELKRKEFVYLAYTFLSFRILRSVPYPTIYSNATRFSPFGFTGRFQSHISVVSFLIRAQVIFAQKEKRLYISPTRFSGFLPNLVSSRPDNIL